MKKLLLIIGTLFLFTAIFSKEYAPTKEQIESFFRTKTLVVMDPNPISEFNFRIKKIIEKHWTITDYDFITLQEFEEKRQDPKYSFVMITKVKFEKDKTYSLYKFLSLLLGGPYLEVEDMPDLCPVPLSYAGVHEQSYMYKIGALSLFIQNHIKLLRDNPGLIKGNIFKHYNERMGDIKGKTLYVVKDELAPEVNTLAKFKKLYPYNIKFVTREEIEAAIDAHNNDVIFLHKVGPEGSKLKARVYKIMIGAGDQKFYYFNFHMYKRSKRPDGLLASDLKKMAKKAAK